jgi:hypothetical protein
MWHAMQLNQVTQQTGSLASSYLKTEAESASEIL